MHGINESNRLFTILHSYGTHMHTHDVYIIPVYCIMYFCLADFDCFTPTPTFLQYYNY